MADRPRLSVSTSSARIDEAVTVRVIGCRPRQAVTVRARIEDARRGCWRSRAVFEADAAGTVDLDEARPLAGGYAMPMFLRSLEDRAAVAAAAIPVERIRGPVLLISGEDDRLWPSPVLADFAAARLAAHRRPVTHLRYRGAGHMIGPIGLPATIDTIVHPLRGRALSLGGSPAGYAAAAADSWPRVIEFLQTTLDSAP